MKLNTLNYRVKSKKIRPGRGIGSGKGKTSGRGHKGQKSRSGVAIKSFEGGQMPLYRRLPKRGFNSFKKKGYVLLNIGQIQKFIDSKKINVENTINIEELKKNNLIKKKSNSIKVLGNGELKDKIKIETNLISKSAKDKIEKIGGSIVQKK
ncbi:MAG: 50S ribosomal protein L15 [Candidatus Pelagibacterales bacterium]|nr:MAG: 50S ribosomal protein L15 [Pelagibacterales bacterium]|tara:strand:+ start:464 stop:916 length:453 start_codon:yes stop_codon:yes gene_type:complete